MALNLEESSGLTAALGYPLFATSGAGNTNISTTNATAYSIYGNAYTATAQAAAAAPVTDFATGLSAPAISGGQGAVIVFGLNASGTLVWMQGKVLPYTNQSALSTEFFLPTLGQAGFCPIAYVVVKNKNTAGTNPWIMGSGFWNASNLSFETPVQIVQLPNAGVFNQTA